MLDVYLIWIMIQYYYILVNTRCFSLSNFYSTDLSLNWSVEALNSKVSEIHGFGLSSIDRLESAGWHLLPSVISSPLFLLDLHALLFATHVHVLSRKTLWLVVILWVSTRNIVVGVWKWRALHLLLSLDWDGCHANVGLSALVHLLLAWAHILQILFNSRVVCTDLAIACRNCSCGSVLLNWISYTFLFLFFICKTVS